MESDGKERWTAESNYPNTESWLLAIWQDLLGREVTAVDNFFDVGGDSMLALEATAIVQDAGYPLLPTSAVFRWPTVAELRSKLTFYASGGVQD